jgi:TPR repeat protein
MGLLSKLRSLDRSKASFQKPSPTHSKTHNSSHSFGSDFLATGSDSSCTLSESHNYTQNAHSKNNSIINRPLAPSTPNGIVNMKTPPPQAKKRPQSEIPSESFPMFNQSLNSTSQPTSPFKSLKDSPQAYKSKIAIPTSRDATLDETTILADSTLTEDIIPQSLDPGAPLFDSPKIASHGQYQHPTIRPVESDSDYSDSEDYSSSDADSDGESESTASHAQQAPEQGQYYEQWRQYYAMMAQQQQQYMAAGRNLMYGPPGAAPMMQQPYYGQNMMMNPMQMQMQMQYMQQQQQLPGMVRCRSHASLSQPQVPRSMSHSSLYQGLPRSGSQASLSIQPIVGEGEDNSYLKSLKRNAKTDIYDNNELISSSRRSTIKSNRYPSVPLSMLSRKASKMKMHSTRVSSVDLNFKPKAFSTYNEEEDNIEAGQLYKSKNTENSVAYGIADLALEDKTENRFISDYSRYLFDDDGEDDEEEESKESSVAPLEEKKSEAVLSNDQLPTPTSTTDSLSRQESSASTNSYNSIQSNNSSSKFIVGSSAERAERMSVFKPNTAAPATELESKKKKKAKRKSPSPKTSDFQSPAPTMGRQTPMIGNVDPSVGGSPYSNPNLDHSTEYCGSDMASPLTGQSRRQSAITDVRRQGVTTPDRSSMMYGTPMGFNPPPSMRNSMVNMNNRASMGFNAPVIPKVNDSTINKKIREFIDLRKVIAMGNKSVNFRLKWVKMLILATNYKLYAYINIKGEPIQPEQGAYNRSVFIKSSVTHLLKLMREYENGKGNDESCKHEVYYLYACLMKLDYLEQYNQDFGLQKNIPQAIFYYENCLSMFPNDYKPIYKLGEIYEFEFPDEFEKALTLYKQAAKLGYNRAIYKVSLLYLNVPSIRSIRYLKYLTDLSNIEPKDIDLDEEDKIELEEVIGLASYQLGRIYEGIYPGDLSADDEFVQKSLELAPVKYAKSLTYYNKSARLNCLLAQVKLGNIYENGDLNRPQNASKSIQWYIKAASSPLTFRRHPEAMLGLSRWCLKGSAGDSKHIPNANPEKALMWCEKAIKEFNSPEALYYMGELAEMGVSYTDPGLWFSRAYELGHQGAAARLGF